MYEKSKELCRYLSNEVNLHPGGGSEIANKALTLLPVPAMMATIREVLATLASGENYDFRNQGTWELAKEAEPILKNLQPLPSEQAGWSYPEGEMYSPKAFAEQFVREHRTLQQSMMRMFRNYVRLVHSAAGGITMEKQMAHYLLPIMERHALPFI